MITNLGLAVPQRPGWVLLSQATVEDCRALLAPEAFGGQAERDQWLESVQSSDFHYLFPTEGSGDARLELGEGGGLAFFPEDTLADIRGHMSRALAAAYGGIEPVIGACELREVGGRTWLYLTEHLLPGANRAAYLLPRADRGKTLTVALVGRADSLTEHGEALDDLVASLELLPAAPAPGSTEEPVTASWPGRREILEARSLEEALQIAADLKKEGRCDWFRGQTAPWPLTPTAARLADDKIDQAIERVGTFQIWARITSGLERLATDEHAFFAVSQHYGEPTFYLDFTDDPLIAAYFATHGTAMQQEQTCCLLGFSTKHFEETVERLWTTREDLETLPRPQIVEIQVDNLWRLEAQRGRFLLSPFRWSIERIYPFFVWIYFPYDASAPRPDIEVYPRNRSALELLLDSFFAGERDRSQGKEVMDWAEDEDIPIVDEWPSEDLYNVGMLHTAAEPLEVHDSWRPEVAQVWLASEAEKWDHVKEAATELRLEVDTATDLGSLEQALRRQAARQLESKSDLRHVLVRWHLGPPAPPVRGLRRWIPRAWQRHSHPLDASVPRDPRLDTVSAWLEGMWDGIRRLPYTHEQCAHAVARCICLGLAVLEGQKDLGREATRAAVSRVLREPVFIEATGWDGTYSRGWVSGPNAEALLLPDPSLLSDMRSGLFGSMSGLELVLFTQTDPRKLFTLPDLADLLVREFIPSQAVTRPVPPHFYSPARLLRFGLP